MTRESGYFGEFGGSYVSETLVAALDELENCYFNLEKDFWTDFEALLKTYVPRPSALYKAHKLGQDLSLDNLYLKREDLNHTGAHKINNCIGQILLARKMGKTRIIAETGAGQHGVATATVCAYFSMPCTVYMGAKDVERQQLNVFRMKLLGAKVVPVTSGTATLKDALNEAIKDWISNVHDTYYLIGSVTGPHPYPVIVRDFQSVIGEEVRAQLGHAPDWVFACVGGGSNAIGIFHPFINDQTRLVGVEASGDGIESGRHAATLSKGKPGILHGSKSYVLQDDDGQIAETHSISAGMDYPGVGPEHSFLKFSGRAEYIDATDQEALDAAQMLARSEGIIPALETAHALAGLVKKRADMKAEDVVVVNLSGRGDKDMPTFSRVIEF